MQPRQDPGEWSRRSASAGRVAGVPAGDRESAQWLSAVHRIRSRGDCVSPVRALPRLYLVVSGQFLRKTERLETRLTLGPARAGDLVELAAALGDGRHTYTLSAQTPGSLLLLPIEALQQAFEGYPPLRMRLLEELAREVSRAYNACCLNRMAADRGSRGNGARRRSRSLTLIRIFGAAGFLGLSTQIDGKSLPCTRREVRYTSI